ncbi:hypothetical protein ACO2Q8_28315 [Larkinella sp. VNQ87]|uniref:hypothetical protein n=1 Tax=Larkinella sp. VNQ87 TaxID=3400921 RepID=UPI003C0ADC2B
MNRLVLTLGLLLLFDQPGFCQLWTKQRIREQLPLLTKFQEIPLGDGRYLLTPVLDTLPDQHVLADLYNRNAFYVSYLFGRYSAFPPETVASREVNLSSKTKLEQQAYLKDTLARLNSALHRAMQNDTLLNRHFLDMTAYYLEAKGIRINDYTAPPKPAISYTTLLKLSSRIFGSIKLIDDQHVVYQLNLSNDRSEVANQPLVEAFSHQAVWFATMSRDWQEYRHDSSFMEEVRSLQNRLAPLEDTPENRTITRQAMQELIARSPLLEQTIKQEYQRMKPWLGFISTD